MTTDSEAIEQYLTFVRTRFSISVLVFVSRDYELRTKFRLIVVCLLRKKNHRKRFPMSRSNPKAVLRTRVANSSYITVNFSEINDWYCITAGRYT